MSAINGDKSRHQINRKRTVLRRMKIRKMVADRAQSSSAAPAPAKATGATSRSK